MQCHRLILLTALAAITWATPTHAAPPEPDGEVAVTTLPVATWVEVAARNLVSGATGAVAVRLGSASEDGPARQATLRVEGFGGATTVRIESPTFVFRPGAANVAVLTSPDSGPLRAGALAVSPDGRGLEATGDAAVAAKLGGWVTAPVLSEVPR
jgi:hypothetical protein